MKYNDGVVYTGEWKADKYHGKGKKEWTEGDYKGASYEGDFKNNVSHGKGVYYWPGDEGKKYVGPWVEGERTGKDGELYIKDFCIYKGGFLKGKYHGKGTIFSENG